jgi:hypothetical protein
MKLNQFYHGECKEKLFLGGADYNDVIAAGVDLFVQPI